MNSKKYILKHNFVNVEDNSINKIFLKNKKDIKLYVKQLLEINFYNTKEYKILLKNKKVV